MFLLVPCKKSSFLQEVVVMERIFINERSDITRLPSTLYSNELKERSDKANMEKKKIQRTGDTFSYASTAGVLQI